jgi:hypothetical protein
VPLGPGRGKSFWHFARALRNVGDELTPFGTLNANASPDVGSGKSLTPFARMHLANASGPVAADVEVVDVLAGTAPVLVDIDGDTLATLVAAVEAWEAVPQPASTATARTADPAQASGRRLRLTLVRWTIGDMAFCSPLGQLWALGASSRAGSTLHLVSAGFPGLVATPPPGEPQLKPR